MTQPNKIISTFQSFLKKENLINQKIIIMVSGGVDSCVLFDVTLKAISSSLFAVFHLNHNLRQNSIHDYNFVKNLCEKHSVKFYGKTLNSEDLPTKNLESFWRTQRQKLVQECTKNFDAKRIITAHHATDLVETMIFRLTKGCGINGLSPFEISTKPFWKIAKSELEAYAQNEKLAFRFDESNDDLHYQRNLIRHKIIPQLRQITPNLEKVFIKESQIFSETADFLHYCSSELISESQTSLKLTDFFIMPPIIQKEFLIKIAQKQTSFAEIKDCLKWLKKNPQGNSEKKIGNTNLKIIKNHITW